MNGSKVISVFTGALAIAGASANEAPGLKVRIETRSGAAPLKCDEEFVTASGQRLTMSRLDFIASGFALRQAGGGWVGPSGWSAYVSAGETRTTFDVPAIPRGRYTRLAFSIGLPPKLNRADPAQYPADHPLNPNVNGLHWGWQGGYVFLAFEGRWFSHNGESRGYSFHLATNRQLMRAEVPLNLTLTGDAEVVLAMDVQTIFGGPDTIRLTNETLTTHSREDDVLADQLRENVESAFTIISVRDLETVGGKPQPPKVVLKAPGATAYPLEIPRHFPRPELPDDNPLTEEGVALGRALFFDPVLSVNNKQSCASCHQPDAGFSDARNAVSTGAEGNRGTRNAMPLFNLAWKRSFFWDGRTSTLREQLLQPIQNPVEMHETLDRAIAKLKTGHSASGTAWPVMFARAFGTADIDADRLARALEQFVLTLMAHDSKFDRVMSGAAEFTPEEFRGFELFRTEYDPGRGQYGADCFHCHGGRLFQSQSFANNGLDVVPRDKGRALVTGRPADTGKFAVPSLRNVALTAPYMHDGRFATLEEAIEHYRTGVKRSVTLDPNLAKHPAGGVPLNAGDKKALVAFLNTLTDYPVKHLAGAAVPAGN